MVNPLIVGHGAPSSPDAPSRPTAPRPPLDFGLVVRRTFDLALSNAATLTLLVVFAWVVPVLAVNWASRPLLGVFRDWIGTWSMASFREGHDPWLVWKLFLVRRPVAAAEAFIPTVMFTGAVLSLLLRPAADGRRRLRALAASVTEARRVAPVWLLREVVVGVGLCLLVLPGLWAAVALSVAAPVAVAERCGPIEAVRRSRALVSGAGWAVLGLIAIFYLASTVWEVGLDFGRMQLGLGPSHLRGWVRTALDFAEQAPVIVLGACGAAALYEALCLRARGGADPAAVFS
jgi:hypothetical protein